MLIKENDLVSTLLFQTPPVVVLPVVVPPVVVLPVVPVVAVVVVVAGGAGGLIGVMGGAGLGEGCGLHLGMAIPPQAIARIM